MVGRLLVIAGASGVGKSTLTARVAASLEFDKVVSTDTIRETLRTQISVEESPALHRSSFQPGGKDTIADWNDTIIPLSDSIFAVIERAKKRGSDLLIEGVHIAPSLKLLDDWRAHGGTACGVLLVVEDSDEHLMMIIRRQQHNGRPARHYLRHFDRIREINHRLISLAIKIDWMVIDVTTENDPIGLIESNFD